MLDNICQPSPHALVQTQYWRVDLSDPQSDAIARAAELIRNGGLVAFPTETVYGLGANALDAAAVSRIYQAKGRPATNPVIVHLTTRAVLDKVVSHWPDEAELLARYFWPGPLTLVLPRKRAVPDIVTAGGPTVAIRVPDHPVALALLDKADVPIAAPSANPSNWISPTSAKHVQRGLDGKIDAILDGGPCRGGIESTVLSLVDNEYRILRCGLIDRPALESVLDRPVLEPPHVQTPDQPLASPGMLQRHYAPNTQTELASGSGWARVERLLEAGNRVGWMPLGVAPAQGADHPRLITRPMPTEPRAYAAKLYATLHELDSLNIDRIVCAEPPDRPAWSAIRDRLRRATAF